MALQLNTSTSIVDYLKSTGQDSSFTARRKIYNDSGLGDRLGEYVGSADQNVTLLKTVSQPKPAAAPATQAVVTAAQPKPTEEFNAQSILDKSGIQNFQLTDIPNVTPPSSADILARARGDTGVQIAEEEKKIGKERVQQDLAQDLSTVRGNFASRGLFFSGARTSAEKSQRDEALRQEMDLDIAFSKILGNAIDRAEGELQKNIEDVIADAQNNRKEEIAFLNSVGLAVDPRTGEVFPTLAAQKEAWDQAYQEANMQFNAAKTEIQLQQAQERIEISMANLELSELRLAMSQEEDIKSTDRLLSLTEIDRFGTTVSGLRFGVSRLSDVSGVDVPEKESTTAPTTAEARRLATAAAGKFTDKLNGWGIPADFTGDFNDDKASDSELTNFLVSRYGVSFSDAKSIVENLE